jgi:hypothetical protein
MCIYLNLLIYLCYCYMNKNFANLTKKNKYNKILFE